MKWIFYLLLLVGIQGCKVYSFDGISIPPEINTFYVNNFENRAPNAPVAVDFQFTEALRNKIRTESKLKQKDTDPDVQFEGEITRYDVTAEAPQEGNTVFLNKLEISVQVRYTNNRDEKEKYDRTFSFFQTFPGDQDLQSVQQKLNSDIFKQITDKIFNETFTAW
jgi:hypothetical protein